MSAGRLKMQSQLPIVLITNAGDGGGRHPYAQKHTINDEPGIGRRSPTTKQT